MTMWHLHPRVRSGSELTLGERAADRVRNAMGSWGFIGLQTVFILAWVGLNLAAWSLHWDAYPFILLNLAFSVQAAYASPLILLSQKRADQRSSELAMHDYEINRDTKKLVEGQAEEIRQLRELAEGQAEILRQMSAGTARRRRASTTQHDQ